MILLVEVLLLFGIIFFAVRLATTGHVDNHKSSEPPQEQIAYEPAVPIS